MFVFSQEQQKDVSEIESKVQKEAVEIFRDRLVVDVFHSFWFNAPASTNISKKFDPGFNVAVLWDFKANKKSPISFGLGVGCTFHTQFSNAQLQYDKHTDLTKYYVLPSVIADSMKLNRVTYINCNIPLEFRYRHKNGFKFTVGVRLGLVAELSQRFKGKNYEDNYREENVKYFLTNNRQKVNFDVYMRCGWKFVGVYYSYQVNALFNEGKGPKVNPMSVGISLSLF
jgi:hypothetical protein